MRIPHADNSLYPIPPGADEEALVMLSDILPTGFECGVLNGKVQPGSSVAIVGAGPVGLAALLTAQFYSPAEIVMIDIDDNRLDIAKRFGATASINSSDGKAAEAVMNLTGNRGVDTAIEAVGIPATFELCEKIVAPGGTIANIGVHGTKVVLHMEFPVGSKHHDHNPSRGYGFDVHASQNGAVREAGSEAADHPSLQARQNPRCLRNLRDCGQHACAQGNH